MSLGRILPRSFVVVVAALPLKAATAVLDHRGG
jgi:hypothetical protein